MLIRKVRKSSINREYSKELQESLELPKHILIKATEVWLNSTFLMLESLLANKAALAIFTAEVKGSPNFSSMEWELMRTVVEMLKPFCNVTIDLQSRRATIASLVPVYRALVHLLQRPGLLLSNVCKAIAYSLEVRMLEWRINRNLCLATMLDPRYKLACFEEENCPMYRSWLEEVGLQITGDVSAKPIAVFATDVLSVPATSAPIERVFSQAGLPCAKHRNRTSFNLLSALEIVE